MELNHMRCDAAQSVRSLDALTDHLLADEFHSSQRGTARTGLYRESVAEIAAVDDHLGSLLG